MSAIEQTVQPDEAVVSDDKAHGSFMSREMIRRNMALLVLIDGVWVFGWTEMQLASSPLFVHLNASNTMIGLINGTFILGLLGVFLSPFITKRFPFKKWYVFTTHIPYLLPWGFIGLGLIFSRTVGFSNQGLIYYILAMSIVSGLGAGFVTLPHQEFIAACIPMSHRGRLSGYGNGIGSGLAIISNALAGWILLRCAKPDAYGYLYLMTWIICQAAFILALFAKERPTPVEKSPKPWSKTMIKAALTDRPFMRVVGLQFIFNLFFMPIIYQFVYVYAFRDLGMPPVTAAALGVTQRVVALCFCGFIGTLIDRISPKRLLCWMPFCFIITILPMLIWHHPLTIYFAVAMGQLVHVGQYGSFNALIYGLPSPENRAGHYTFQIMMGGYIATSLGPVIIGALCDVFSYRQTFLLIGIIALIMIPLSRRILKGLSERAEDYA